MTKRTEVATSISEKFYFNSKPVAGDEEGHCILIKETIHHQDETIIKLYAANSRDTK